MKIRMVLAGLAAVVMALPVIPAQAQGRAIYFNNNSDWAVWVTVYHGPGRDGKEVFGCVTGGGGSLMLVPTTATYSILHEVKESKTSCSVHSNRKTIEPGARGTATHTVYSTAAYTTGLDIKMTVTR